MANFYPFLIYVVVTTFTPGPNNLLAMSHAMRFGYRRTLGFLAGVFTGFLTIMLVCGLLNVFLVSLLPEVQVWLNVLGAVYMLYLAVHTLLSKPGEEKPGQANLNSFAAGISLQFLNLKVILFGITVFSLFITPSFQNPLIVSLFAPFLALIGITATSSWAFGGSIFRNIWRKYYRLFNLAMGSFLIYSAVASLFFNK